MGNLYKTRMLKQEEYEIWDSFVDQSIQGSIFNKTWWLQAVADNFDILICEDGNEIIGGIALPYHRGRFYRNPKLTPALGIIFKDFSSLKQSNKTSKEIEIANALIMGFPKFKLFEYTFSYKYNNYLPFKWKGFNIDLAYTYIIDCLTDMNLIFNGFKSNIKSDIRKAIKNGIKVVDNLAIEDFYRINKKTFDRQGIEIPYSKTFIKDLDLILKEKGARRILFAVDHEERIHAAVYILFDRRCAYYLMGGGDPSLRNSGATSLLIWEAIKFAGTVSQKFDFEGSSLPNVERFFRSFGGELETLVKVSKIPIFVRTGLGILRSQKNLLRRLGLIS